MNDAAIAEAGPAWGGFAASPRLINERENAVYEARLHDGARVAMRLHRIGYQSHDAIRSELIWTDALAAKGFRCPRPVPTKEGAMVHKLGSGQFASAVSWVDAHPVGANGVAFRGGDAALVEHLHALGQMTRQMHKLTDEIDTAALVRPGWDLDGLLGDDPHWGRFWENPSLTQAERGLLLNARKNAAQQLFENSALDIGLIHADLLQENILQNADGLCIIDFDDSGFGYRLYDLGTALIQHAEHPDLTQLTDALCAGYGCDTDLIPLFMMLRAMASCGWISARAAADDPGQRFYSERAVTLAGRYLGHLG